MASHALSWISVSLLVLLASWSCVAARSARVPRVADPTDGFRAVSLDQSNFELQRPFDEAIDARYSFDGTVRKMWVLSSDKPHARQSHTRPRTEIRIAVSLPKKEQMSALNSLCFVTSISIRGFETTESILFITTFPSIYMYRYTIK